MRKALVRLAGLSAVTAALATGTGTFGQQQRAALPPFPQASTPAQSAYTVTPQAGPWLICGPTYDGHVYEDKAQALAEEMAQEIRTKFGLPAYIFNHSAEEKRLEKERVARRREELKKVAAQYGVASDAKLPQVKTYRIFDQYAVLVGGYKDDDTARKELDRIRKLKPSDKLMHTAFSVDAKGKQHQEAVNPFQGAFVCRNPSIPRDKSAADNQPDPRLKEYNADEKYSLLKCRKPFTLVVKSYQGAAAVVSTQGAPNAVKDKGGFFSSGPKPGDLLAANAKMAHDVADMMRKSGFEAYVLNTESNSYVTVGGYDAPDDPRLRQMQQAFMNEMRSPTSTIGQLNVKGMVNFFAEPMPMPVPQVK